MSKPKRPQVRGLGGDADFVAEIATLTAKLRERNADPACASWPVLHAYSRISKAMGDHDEEKPERFMVEILRAMLTMDVRLGEVLMDRAKSAWKKNGKRPAWTQLLELLEAGDGNGAFVNHVDRLMRQPWDLETLFRLEDAHRLTLRSLHGEYMLGNADHRFALRIIVAAACKESDDKSRRIRNLNAARREAGNGKNGPAAFGHRNDPSELSDVDLHRQQEAIRFGATALITGTLSLGAIAREWNDRGLRTRGGNRWSAPKVLDCLRLERHAGLVTYGKNTIRESANAEDRILSLDEFRDLQNVLKGRKRSRQSAEGKHWLSSILRCGKCGTPLVGCTEKQSYPDGEPKRTYRCPPRGCMATEARGGIGVDARWAERWAADQMVTILSDPTHQLAIGKRRKALSELSARIGLYLRTIEATQVRRSITHMSRWAAIDAELAELESQLAPLLAERDAMLAVQPMSNVPTDVDAVYREITAPGVTDQHRHRLAALAFPNGFYVRPVGKGARLRGEAVMDRFTLEVPEHLRSAELAA